MATWKQQQLRAHLIRTQSREETLLFESVAGLENLHEVLRRFIDRSLVRLLQLEVMLKKRGDFFSSRCRFFSTSSSWQLVVVRKVGDAPMFNAIVSSQPSCAGAFFYF